MGARTEAALALLAPYSTMIPGNTKHTVTHKEAQMDTKSRDFRIQLFINKLLLDKGIITKDDFDTMQDVIYKKYR